MTRDGLVYYLIFKWWLRLSDLIWQFLFHDEKNILSIKFKIGTRTGIGIVFFFINNAAKPVVCEVWHMRRTFAWPQNFHKQVVPPLFIEVPVQKQGSEGSFLCARCIDFARFYQFWIIFCNCSDGVIFHFILLQTIEW